MNDFTDLPADSPWWAKWLVDNWREIYRELSTWFIAATGALAAFSEMLPTAAPQIQAAVGASTLHYLTAACAIAALLSKFYKQGAKE